MLTSWRKWGWEFLCFLVFFILTAYQIFLPPVTGLANNSDFSYVLGKLSICPADLERQDNIYLVTDYFYDPAQCTSDIGLVSIEVPLTIAATYLSSPFTGEKNFDLRALPPCTWPSSFLLSACCYRLPGVADQPYDMDCRFSSS